MSNRAPVDPDFHPPAVQDSAALPAPSYVFAGGTFAEVWEAAQTLSRSPLVPTHFRGQPESVLIALEAAHRQRQSPLLVMQNLCVIQGRLCWSAQYVIAMANASGKFRGPIRWRSAGEGDTLALTAYARLAEDSEEVSITVSLAMAKADGWYNRNPKYRTMPDLMLRYRSATLLVRLFAPEVLLGYHEREELVDAGKAEPVAEYSDPVSLSSSPSRSVRGQPAPLGGSGMVEGGSIPSPAPPVSPGVGVPSVAVSGPAIADPQETTASKGAGPEACDSSSLRSEASMASDPATTEAPAPVAAPTPTLLPNGHHPSWEEEGVGDRFRADLKALGLDYYLVCDVLAAKGRPRPSAQTHEQRRELLDWFARRGERCVAAVQAAREERALLQLEVSRLTPAELKVAKARANVTRSPSSCSAVELREILMAHGEREDSEGVPSLRTLPEEGS